MQQIYKYISLVVHFSYVYLIKVCNYINSSNHYLLINKQITINMYVRKLNFQLKNNIAEL